MHEVRVDAFSPLPSLHNPESVGMLCQRILSAVPWSIRFMETHQIAFEALSIVILSGESNFSSRSRCIWIAFAGWGVEITCHVIYDDGCVIWQAAMSLCRTMLFIIRYLATWYNPSCLDISALRSYMNCNDIQNLRYTSN